jgi:hypothetical protein
MGNSTALVQIEIWDKKELRSRKISNKKLLEAAE